MDLTIEYSRQRLTLQVADAQVIGVERQAPAPPLADPAAAVREALETPYHFPALRRALTPDDHVVIVVDEHLPRPAQLLAPVLDHLASAHIAVEAITLLCPPSAAHQERFHQLPAAAQEIRVEVHDPLDRNHLSYLATTKHGRRIYLNRTAVDADQLIVLASHRYDPLLGYGGGLGMLYPRLSDEETRQELCRQLSVTAPGGRAGPARQEATEVAWLLGAPFFIQLIEGTGDELVQVIAGTTESSAEADRLLDARWRETAEKPAQTVLATLSGDPARHDFADLARALACAARVVEPGGRILLLSEANPTLGPGATLLSQADDPGKGLELLRRDKPVDMSAAFQWASAVRHARVYVLSGLPEETVEDLHATPLENAAQVQRLLGDETVLLVRDAHKALTVTEVGAAPRRRARAARG